MVAIEMASSVTKPPKLPKGNAAPRAKSTNSHHTSKHMYTRTLKSNSSINVNNVYKSRSDTSLTSSIRNLSLRSSSASSQSSASSSTTSGSRRFSSAGHVNKTVEDIARQIAGKYFKNIVVMAGAGISTASGIPDFRTPGTGLYDNLKQYRIPYPQAIFDIDYFSRCPKPFYTLAKELYPTGRHRPNYVHYFLRLLYEKGILLRVYTQNIDGLERLAGIPQGKLIEAHGSFTSASCVQCKQAYPETEVKGAILGDKVPRCKKPGCFGLVKPDIVFFGEDLPRRFYYYLRDFPQADLLLVMGTSLEVEPFADIVDSVRMYVPRVLFNREAVGPFEKKRRTNDIVVEDPRNRLYRHPGDIVEKVRGFVLQLGWKKELDMLIEECENQYKRQCLHQSPTPAIKDSSPDINVPSLTTTQLTTIHHSPPTPPLHLPINKPGQKHQHPQSQTQTVKLDGRPSQALSQEENKAKGSETQSSAQRQASKFSETNQATKTTTSQNTTQTGERVIAGPNSCFNPAQLRLAAIGRTWTTGSDGTGVQKSPRREGRDPGGEGLNSGARTDRGREGGAMGGGGGGRVSSVLPGDHKGEETPRRDTSEPEHQGESRGGEKGPHITPIKRHTFEGVGQLKQGHKNEDGPKTCNNEQEDDLRGFFTLTLPSESSRKVPQSANAQLERSPRATNLCLKPDSKEVASTETSESRVNEWLSSNPTEASPDKLKSESSSLSEGKPSPGLDISPDVIHKPPVLRRHKTSMITRELVRLKMRANLKDEAKPESQLFQTRTMTSLDERPISKPSSEQIPRPQKSRNPGRLVNKPRRSSARRTPPRSPVCKPLFTGLRHQNISMKTKPVTATITKTTIGNPSSGIVRYDIDTPLDQDRQTLLSAGSLPKMSYRHRLNDDLPNTGGSAALANLLSRTLEPTPRPDLMCNKMAKVGTAN